MTTYLTGIALLLLVMSPPLIPLMISGIRAVANWRTGYEWLRSLVEPQGAALAAA
jgi:hypothetical protein